MHDYIIMTDSSCDLPDTMVRELDLQVLPLAFTIDGQTYLNYPDNREMSPEELCRRQKAGSMATTNAVNVGQATESMECFLKEGKDILVLAFSSGLSTTCNSFQIAANDLAQQYPNQTVCVVDTLCASLGQGLIVYLAAQMKQAGKSLNEVQNWVEANKLNVCHWFTVNDLFFLKKGGRVSAATAVVGTMLQIKPILHVDDEGHLIKTATARGRRGSLDALMDRIGELATDPSQQVVFLSHTDSHDEASQMASDIKARYGVKEVIVNHIGPVIGAHTGPGCIALFFMGKHR